MIIKCHIKDCKYNNKNKCSKEEIEIMKVSAYDADSAECLDYEIVDDTDKKCPCNSMRSTNSGMKCSNCGREL